MTEDADVDVDDANEINCGLTMGSFVKPLSQEYLVKGSVASSGPSSAEEEEDVAAAVLRRHICVR